MTLDDSNQEFVNRSTNLLFRLLRLFFLGYGIVILIAAVAWLSLGVAMVVALASN